MLAYVFWHSPKDAADRRAYERDLDVFHAELAAAGVPGFRTSRTVPSTWPDAGAYEDWYLVDGFADLDALASGAWATPGHAPLARAVRSGTAGVYRLTHGVPFAPGVASVGWMTKRDDVSYPALSAEHAARVAAGELAAVWQRQLVLGPAPEFRLEST